MKVRFEILVREFGEKVTHGKKRKQNKTMDWKEV